MPGYCPDISSKNIRFSYDKNVAGNCLESGPSHPDVTPRLIRMELVSDATRHPNNFVPSCEVHISGADLSYSATGSHIRVPLQEGF